MPDPGFVRGTTLRRNQLALRGAALLVGGLVALGVGFSGALVAAINPLLIIGGLVAVYAGADRLIWALRRRRMDLLFGLASTWLILLIAVAALAPVLPLGEHEDVAATITDPIYLEPFKYGDHILGTNGSGLDMLARVIYGARASLTISLMAVTIGLIAGSAIGIIAGFYRRKVDSVIGVFTNALLAVPPLILLIVLATVLDPKVRNMAIALSLLTIPTMVRLARANTIAYSQREFVLAARALGATKGRIMLRELLPNVLPPMLSMAVVVMSALIVAEASLSFLGLGIQPPTPTWGNMILEAEANDTMTEHPFILLVPGVVLFLTVYSVNLLGERAQQRWDPRGAKL